MDSTAENLRIIIENQRLILQRIALIETHLDAVYSIQGDYLGGILSAPEEQRADVRGRYSKRPEELLPIYEAEGLNKSQQYLPERP